MGSIGKMIHFTNLSTKKVLHYVKMLLITHNRILMSLDVHSVQIQTPWPWAYINSPTNTYLIFIKLVIIRSIIHTSVQAFEHQCCKWFSINRSKTTFVISNKISSAKTWWFTINLPFTASNTAPASLLQNPLISLTLSLDQLLPLSLISSSR